MFRLECGGRRHARRAGLAKKRPPQLLPYGFRPRKTTPPTQRKSLKSLEAPPGFEPGIRDLQKCRPCPHAAHNIEHKRRGVELDAPAPDAIRSTRCPLAGDPLPTVTSKRASFEASSSSTPIFRCFRRETGPAPRRRDRHDTCCCCWIPAGSGIRASRRGRGRSNVGDHEKP